MNLLDGVCEQKITIEHDDGYPRRMRMWKVQNGWQSLTDDLKMFKTNVL